MPENNTDTKEIDKQIKWTEQVMKKVLKETGCFLSHHAVVIVIQEFSKRVKELEEQHNAKAE